MIIIFEVTTKKYGGDYMMSLKEARMKAIEICGEESSYEYTELSLRTWSDKGVISHENIKKYKRGYPDIILTEIITAIRLLKK